MRKIGTVVALLFATIIIGSTVYAELPWCDFSDGLKQAKAENKPVMVLFESPACYVCDQLKATLKKPEIEQKLQGFVVTHIVGYDPNLRYEYRGTQYSIHDLAKLFGVRNRPALLFLTADGEKIALFRGGIRSKRMLEIIDKVIAYTQAGSSR